MKKVSLILLLSILYLGTNAQAIVLRRPSSGDIWPAYSKQRIEWTSTNIERIKIESSFDAGKTWNVEAAIVSASAGFYEWEVPNRTSDSCYIRITDTEFPSVNSSNFPNNPFKIPPPGITIDTIPSNVLKGSVQPITWISSGVKKVNIFLSLDNKASFIKIADTVNANNFYFNWIVNNSAGSQCYIVINDASNNKLSDTLKQSFSLVNPPNLNLSKYKGGAFDGHASSDNKVSSLKLLTLNAADSIYGSTQQNIKWSSRNVDLINIYFSTDNGVAWTTIVENISASAGQYSWKASATPTNQGRIKLVSKNDSTLISISTNAFVIRKKKLKFSSIDSSSTFNKGGVIPISWESGGVNLIKLKLISNSKDSTLKDSIPANYEMYNWIIHPSTVDSFKLVLVDLADSTVSDTVKNIVLKTLVNSNPAKYRGGSFDGHASKSNTLSSIKLIYPNGGESLSVQNNTTITWKNNNIEKIKLELSIDSGRTWTTLNSNITGTINSFIWKTPNSPSNKCLIKVSDAADASIFDITDSIFSLQPKSLLFTTDSTDFIKETAKSIEWKPEGVDTVRIKFKSKLLDSYQIIKDSLPARLELFNWILPATLGDSIWMRIEDLRDSSVNDQRTYFSKTNTLIKNISPTKYRGGRFDGHAQRSNINKLIIRKPEANEVLVGGSKYAITWSTVNLEDSVLIEFTIDSGRTWNTVTRTLASTGKYEWTIPNSIQGRSVNVFDFGTIRSASTDQGIQNYNSTAPIIINSSKCQIRAVDISAGNIVAGSTSNNFAIVASTTLLKDTISFSPPKTMTLGDTSQTLFADATSKRLVKFFIDSGATKATINASAITARLAGKVRIGAYVEKDSLYNHIDTVYQTICINPVKPVIPYTGKLLLCNNDSAMVIGTAGFNQYLWSNNATSSSIKINSTTNIALKVGVDGCFSASSDTLKFIKSTSATPTISAGSATSFCTGGSVVLSSSASSGNQWFRDGSIITGATNATFTATQSGNYTVVTTNASGCASATSTATTITVNPLPTTPTISAGSATSFCTGGSVVLSSSASSGNQWFRDGSIITGATNATFTATQSGNYTVVTTNASGCASATSTATTITVNPLPTTPSISAGSATSFCTGGSVVLSSSASSGNQWFRDGSIITGATNTTFTATQSGNYTVRSTNTSGCASATSTATTITVNPLPTTPTISAGSATSFCTGGSVVLSSSASSGNQWFRDGSIITGATNTTFTATQSGNYTVVTTNASGCASATSTATTITVNPLPTTPTISAGSATSFCTGGSVVLSSSASSGNQWFRDGSIITGATNATFTATQSGVYSVKIANANGCESSSTNTIVTANSIPTKATITQTGADLISSSNAGNQWFKDADMIVGATNNSYRPLVSGYYRVQVRLNGCSGPMSDSYFYLVTSILNTNTSAETYKLFPNPVKDKFLIDAGASNHKISFQIFDANGKRMMSNTFSKNIIVDISRLNSGIYTILITNTKTLKQESKQIIKQ